MAIMNCILSKTLNIMLSSPIALHHQMSVVHVSLIQGNIKGTRCLSILPEAHESYCCHVAYFLSTNSIDSWGEMVLNILLTVYESGQLKHCGRHWGGPDEARSSQWVEHHVVQVLYFPWTWAGQRSRFTLTHI